MNRGSQKHPATSLKYILAFVLIVAAGVVYKFVIKNNHSGIMINGPEQQTAASSVTSSSASATAAGQISVYICGEVNNPGIYNVSPGIILNDVAELAGGFTEGAALDHLDLVYRINDNMSLFIPNEDNLDEGDSCILRKPSNDQGDPGSGGNNGLVNINTADQAGLMTLPGIGESLAKSIISYRADHRFGKIEDIRNVSGIGESKFNRIKDLICV